MINTININNIIILLYFIESIQILYFEFFPLKNIMEDNELTTLIRVRKSAHP
jgi:hypothetical protein